MSTFNFYDDLPVHRLSLGSLLRQENLFVAVPSDWHVIITDIKSSTQAVHEGLHENVNLIATGSIVSVLNIAFAMNILVPFFFGGDGATFIVPPVLLSKVMQSLALYRTNTLNNFNLELRTGTIPVQQIYQQGYEMQIARYSSSETFYIPVLVGNGLNYAERQIKGPDYLAAEHQLPEEELDLSGMQCRWDRIPVPEDKEEIVTLLVVARDGIRQSACFAKVMDKIDNVFGAPPKRQPISVSRLKLKTSFSRLGAEMRARIGRIKWLDLLQTWLITLYGHIYFRTESGEQYLKSLVEMSDTLVIDGKVNTVISGTEAQRKTLQNFLDEMETSGQLYYGIHLSGASVMSCYVRDFKDSHIHFVDGSEGGYTQAAKMLKGKLHISNLPKQ
jgi:hypothetical protein